MLTLLENITIFADFFSFEVALFVFRLLIENSKKKIVTQTFEVRYGEKSHIARNISAYLSRIL